MISAYDFGGRTPPRAGSQTPRYSFGVGKESVVSELRRLADDIETEEVLVKDVLVVSRAKSDDFTETRLILGLVEKLEPT